MTRRRRSIPPGVEGPPATESSSAGGIRVPDAVRAGHARSRRRRSLHLEVDERVRFETLLAELSSSFINLPAAEIDAAIARAQQHVCETLGIEFSVLWQWSTTDPALFTVTHHYGPAGTPIPAAGIDGKKSFPWVLERMFRGETLVVFTEQLPPEAAADRESRRRFGVKSSVHIPLAVGGAPMTGVLTFAAIEADLEWPPEIVSRLQLVAQVFSNALDRKRTDQLLRESEENLALAAESAGAGLWILDLTDYRFWMTPKTRELFGLMPDEVVTWDRLQSVVLPEDREATQAAIEHTIRSGESVLVEYRARRSDGTVRWFASRGRRRYVAGRHDSVMGVSADITDRKLGEVRWQAAIEASPGAMIVVDATGTIALANRATEELFGYVRMELVGRPLDMLLPERDRAAHDSVWAEYLVDPKPRDMGAGRQLHGLRKNGSEVVIEAHLTPIPSLRGQLVLISIVDLTAREILESEARRVRSEIARLARGAMLGELAGALAHEMNQPLTAILCNAQAARHLISGGTPDLGEIRTILDDIIADDERAGDAILRLRALLKKGESQFRPLRINDVVLEVLRLARFDLLVPGTRTVADLAPDLPEVAGDPVRLQQAILNLVVNASEAMAHLPPTDRRVVLRTGLDEDGSVIVSVIDRGKGIESSAKKRMFESFFSTSAGGLGLGLPISRIIIAAHGGILDGENNPDGGSTFRVTLRPAAPRKSDAALLS